MAYWVLGHGTAVPCTTLILKYLHNYLNLMKYESNNKININYEISILHFNINIYLYLEHQGIYTHLYHRFLSLVSDIWNSLWKEIILIIIILNLREWKWLPSCIYNKNKFPITGTGQQRFKHFCTPVTHLSIHILDVA